MEWAALYPSSGGGREQIDSKQATINSKNSNHSMITHAFGGQPSIYPFVNTIQSTAVTNPALFTPPLTSAAIVSTVIPSTPFKSTNDSAVKPPLNSGKQPLSAKAAARAVLAHKVWEHSEHIRRRNDECGGMNAEWRKDGRVRRCYDRNGHFFRDADRYREECARVWTTHPDHAISQYYTAHDNLHTTTVHTTLAATAPSLPSFSSSSSSSSTIDIDDTPHDNTVDISQLICHIRGCSVVTHSIAEMERHYHNQHKQTHVCRICRKVFASNRLCDIHFAERHDTYFSVAKIKQPMVWHISYSESKRLNCCVMLCRCVDVLCGVM